MEHVEDRPGGRRIGAGTEVIGTTIVDVDADRVDQLAETLADPTEPLRIIIADFMTDNADRYDHSREVLADPTRPERRRLVPIDHAGCLAGNPDPERLLEGAGRQARFITVREPSDPLAASIGRYVRAAVAERLFRA